MSIVNQNIFLDAILAKNIFSVMPLSVRNLPASVRTLCFTEQHRFAVFRIDLRILCASFLRCNRSVSSVIKDYAVLQNFHNGSCSLPAVAGCFGTQKQHYSLARIKSGALDFLQRYNVCNRKVRVRRRPVLPDGKGLLPFRKETTPFADESAFGSR